MARPQALPLDLVVQTYQRLQSASATAAELGLSKGSVRNYLIRAGVQLIPTKFAPKGLGLLDADIARMYVEEKKSSREIARALGVDAASVLKNLERQGIARRPSEVGESGPSSPHWKGGRFVHQTGYVYLKMPDHPCADARGYVLEHRLVMERHIGRPLSAEEVVHHIDRNRRNNQIQNLMLLPSKEEHSLLHAREDGTDLRVELMISARKRRRGEHQQP